MQSQQFFAEESSCLNSPNKERRQQPRLNRKLSEAVFSGTAEDEQSPS